jgi:hypothetical protein
MTRAIPLLILLVPLAVSGCNSGGAADLAVERDLARESLAAFLDAWQAGQTADDLKNRSPSIIAGDHAFATGTKLVSYTLVGDDTDDGANLHTTVDLVLQDDQAGEVKQRVAYIIGTEPVITIFRADE